MRYLLLFVTGLLILGKGFSQPSLDGSWKTKNGSIVSFVPTGKLNKGYLLVTGQEAFWVKQSKTSLIFLNKEKKSISSTKLTFKGDSLIYSDPYLGQLSATKILHYLPHQYRQNIPEDSNSFFDFSTDKYYAGYFFDLCPKGHLPFYISKAFIKNNLIDTVSLLFSLKTMHDTTVVSEKTQCVVTYYFKDGLTSQMSVINNEATHSADSIRWNYFYSKNGSLDSIQIPGGRLKFDLDGAVVDEHGFKIWWNDMPMFWEYKNGLPSKAIRTYGGGYQKMNLFFKYNGYNQLAEIEEHDSANSASFISYHFEYDQRGVPTKISKVNHLKDQISKVQE